MHKGSKEKWSLKKWCSSNISVIPKTIKGTKGWPPWWSGSSSVTPAPFIVSSSSWWGCTWQRNRGERISTSRAAFNGPRGSFLGALGSILDKQEKKKPPQQPQWSVVKQETLFEQLKANRLPINPRLDAPFGRLKKWPRCCLSRRICSWLRMNDRAWGSDQTVHARTHAHTNPRLSLFCLVKENTPAAVLSYITAVASATALTKEWLCSDWLSWSCNVLGSLLCLNQIIAGRGCIFIHCSGT